MKKFFVLLVGVFFLSALAACQGGTIKIGVVLPDASEERWKQQDGAFFEEELKKLGAGYEYEILFSGADEAKEKTNIEALAAKGAKVIILTAHGSGAGAVQAAKDAGVKIVAHDRMAKSSTLTADYYTTFNSWNVGKAQGQHLLDMANALNASATNKIDLALFSGRTADWPNATYFFGGAMEVLKPHFDKFNLINLEAHKAAFNAIGNYTEATFNDDAKSKLQAAMNNVDTDWNPQTAATKAQAVVAALGDADKSNDTVLVLAPNDDTSAAIRQEFAKMPKPYKNYYTTGQDASEVTLASLMGDPIKGKGTQTMTVFKDTSKLVKDSVAIAKNIVDGKDGLTGLTGGPKIDNVPTAYTAIDTLLATDKQKTYDLIFKTGYKKETSETFSNINFAPYKK